MLAAIIIIGAVLLAAVIIGYIMLQMSVLRHPMPDLSNPKILAATKWNTVEPQITHGVNWLRAREKEDVSIRSFDGKKLCARFVPHKNAKGTILLMHGYRSSYVLDFACALEFYYNKGYNLLICDQRSHNHSQGQVITLGVKERFDAVSWTAFLSRKLGKEHPMFLVGLSMGAATVLMASCLEHEANVRGIIADCGFTSPKAILTHVAKHKMRLPAGIVIPMLGFLTRTFCGFRLDECSTTEALAKTRLPIALIHGKEDNFVPCYMSEENYAAAGGEKHILLVEGASHGFSYMVDPQGYEKLVSEFLEKHTGVLSHNA